MNFNIQVKLEDPTGSLQKHFVDCVDRKIGKIVDLDDESVSIFGEMSKTTGNNNADDLYRAELVLKIAGKDYFSKEEMHDMILSIEKVCDEIFHMINKDQNKERDKERKDGSRVKKLLRKIGLK